MSDARLMFSWGPLAMLGEPTTNAAGDVETEIDILELVPQEQVGGAGKFHVTAEKADEMIRNHADEASRGYEPPMVLGHPRHADGSPDEAAPAVGWITGLSRAGTRLRARVRLLADFAEQIRRGAFRFVSPEFRTKAFSSTGEAIGGKVFRVGVTNTPHQKGADGLPVGAFQLAEAGAGVPPMAFDAEKACADLAQKFAALADQVAEFIKKPAAPPPPAASPEDEEKAMAAAKKLSEIEASVKTLNETLPGLTAALSEAKAAGVAKDAEIKTLSENVASLQQVALSNDIRAEIARGKSGGKFSPAQLKGSDEDPVKWLSESAFNGLAGLRKHVENAPKVVDAAPSVALTGTPAPAAAASAKLTEADAKAAGYATLAEMTTALKAHGALEDDDTAAA